MTTLLWLNGLRRVYRWAPITCDRSWSWAWTNLLCLGWFQPEWATWVHLHVGLQEWPFESGTWFYWWYLKLGSLLRWPWITNAGSWDMKYPWLDIVWLTLMYSFPLREAGPYSTLDLSGFVRDAEVVSGGLLLAPCLGAYAGFFPVEEKIAFGCGDGWFVPTHWTAVQIPVAHCSPHSNHKAASVTPWLSS